MRHRYAGLVYLASLGGLVLSGSVLAVEAWSDRWHLFALGVLALGAATFGYVARPSRKPTHVRTHRVAMGCSYIIMLTAFYVDNGPRLPLW